MNIIVDKEELSKGISIVQKAVPVHTTMDILLCILLEAEDGKLRLTANNLELGIETSFAANVLEDGKVALNARLFSEIIRKLPDGEVTIISDGNDRTLIKCGKAKYNISGQNGEEFSYLPDIEKTEPIIISQFSLKEMIRQTIFSISTDEVNPLLTGELFEIRENRLRIASLDGQRISVRNINLSRNSRDVREVIPGKTFQDMSKILSDSMESMVEIYFTKQHVLFEFDETRVVSRLIEGNYFNIDHMMTSDYSTKVEINKREFLECLERAQLLIREGERKPIIMQIRDGGINFDIKTGLGTHNEEVEAEKQGNDLIIGFNPKFFTDALRTIDDEIVVMYMTSAKAPCYIRDDEESYIYTILPINIGY